MESESSFIARQLRFFTATLYAQIKLSTRDGLTDLPKNQEISLLSLINLAFGTDFVDLNSYMQNFPGLDYGSHSRKTGLQMTATVTKKKFQDTINTHDSNSVLKNNYPRILFFLLTVEQIKPSLKVQSPNVEYITLFDMVNAVLKKDREFQTNFLSCLKKEYSSYFSFNHTPGNIFSLPTEITIPSDLMLLNEMISTHEWFPENHGEGYIKVFDLIDNFQKRLSKCTRPAREILVSIIKLAQKPSHPNQKIIVYADEVLGSLDIDEAKMPTFEYHYKFLEVNRLVDKQDEYQNIYSIGDDVYINNRLQFVLNYGPYEPDINIFSTLFLFYLNRHSINDFEEAFLKCDFSKLSDSCC